LILSDPDSNIYAEIDLLIIKGERKNSLTDKIKCSHILVKKQSEAIAILERLKKGKSFANFAKELSIDKGSANYRANQNRIWISYN
jgi:parvulin-like peptidyl-prolyl isomerase